MTKDCYCHDQKRILGVDKRARNKLIIASGMSVLFIIAEVTGGYLANSLAIASDAAHLLADLASFMISLLALHLASRRPTKKLTFGWHRAEILGAVISIILLWMITCVLCYAAVRRVMEKDFDVKATIMLITASCGVAFNLVMMIALHPGGHHHTHQGNSNESENSWLSDSDKEKLTLSTPENGQGERNNCYGGLSIKEPGEEQARNHTHHSHQGNINVLASFLHVLGDLLQSIGVLIAAIIIYFKPTWKLADPVCTFLFSVIVIATTVQVLRDLLIVLMEGTPRNLDFKNIHESLKGIPEVKDIHDLRIWSMSMNKLALSVHVAVSNTSDSMDVLKKVTSFVRIQLGITESNIQIEDYSEDMIHCTHCIVLKD